MRAWGLTLILFVEYLYRLNCGHRVTKCYKAINHQPFETISLRAAASNALHAHGFNSIHPLNHLDSFRTLSQAIIR